MALRMSIISHSELTEPEPTSSPAPCENEPSASSTLSRFQSPPSDVPSLPQDNDEYKLPNLGSLFVILGGNVIHELSFYIIVSSVSLYANHLGGLSYLVVGISQSPAHVTIGTETFSGLVIGIPTVCSGLILLPMGAIDGGHYLAPMYISYACLFLGAILYSLAYVTSFLYLILIGRTVTGFGYICFMYSKRYCTDSRIVGVRRRSTLAAWLVLGQGVGLSLGPFIGGLLYKIGFENEVFNGYTSPGWVLSGAYVVLILASIFLFNDVPASQTSQPSESRMVKLGRLFGGRRQVQTSTSFAPPTESLSSRQKGLLATMIWFSMLTSFNLGGWEANIPIYAGSHLGYNPYNSGNFLALGGVIMVPFLLLNVRASGSLQDRTILATGTFLGVAGILIMMTLVATENVTRASYFICWVLVGLGFNLASTCTFSLLSKQLPPEWNHKSNMAIQYSNYVGNVGGAGMQVGMQKFFGLQIAITGVGIIMYMTLWKEMKTKTG